ncbi:MAG: hypothetical protein H7833_06050 [Magnetococcus sp. DMHC-1]|nr:hypothetical protein [Magnetococcales bacterium]
MLFQPNYKKHHTVWDIDPRNLKSFLTKQQTLGSSVADPITHDNDTIMKQYDTTFTLIFLLNGMEPEKIGFKHCADSPQPCHQTESKTIQTTKNQGGNHENIHS